MKQKYIACIIVFGIINFALCVGSFQLGLMYKGLRPLSALIIPVILGVSIGLLTLLVPFIFNKVKKEEDKKSFDVLGRPLTKKEDYGYSLNSSDLYEAVDKLGYIEHELNIGGSQNERNVHQETK